jgi:parallel beta-helix repeat protein
MSICSAGAPDAWITIKPYNESTSLLGDGDTIVRVMNCAYLKIHDFDIKGEVDRIPLSTAKAVQFVYKDKNGKIQLRVAKDLTEEQISQEKLPILGPNIERPSYTDTKGIYMSDSHHIQLSGNNVHHLPGGGIRVAYSEYVDVVDNEVHNCARKSCSGTHGIVATFTPDRLQQEDPSSKYRVRILRNLVHHNFNEIYSWSPQKSFIHPRIDEGKGISLQRNQVFKNGGRILIANNIAFWNGFSGVHNHDGDNVDMVANTCYMNSYTNTVTYKGGEQKGNQIGISHQVCHRSLALCIIWQLWT